ncbi:MAG: TRAP transporter substrate-binding protein DctP [Myxococcales bacterium]|nr:TRAP transporter substrate-binding protein DctP [Myxococcales bacterium]
MRPLYALVVAAAMAYAAAAKAEPVTLRMAAIAPEGTEWARALKAYAQEVETQTKGELRVKWYLGGVAGDELTALDRIKRGQLDGEAGAIFCQRLAPSLRAARLPAMYRTRDEAIYVMGRLRPILDDEFRKSGFANLGESLFGADVLFSRAPIRTFDELVATRLWAWSLDPIWQQTASEIGFKTVVTTIEEHSPAWRRKQYDAFFTVPAAALAYQWSTEAAYVSDLTATVLPACMVLSNAAMDPLPLEARQVLVASSAKFMHRFNEISARLDASLVAGMFQRQGLVRVDASPELHAQFDAAAKRARDKLGAGLIAPSLLESVEKMLAEYRAGHRADAAKR